jgi:hypothetical protein
VATFNCGAQYTNGCPATDPQCFCQPELDHLEGGPSHIILVSSDVHRCDIWAAGNYQGVYIDDLNTNWSAGGAARADAAIATAQAGFPNSGVPKWFFVNEISAGTWPGDATYRQFVVDFVTRMNVYYGKSVIVASPFATPSTQNAASWKAVAAHAYVAVENYLTGADINAHANSVSWCQTQYQASVDAYAANGVALSRLMLVEHFAQTTANTNRGRSGDSVAGWKNAIAARSQAAHAIGFAGFASYAWAFNQMAETEANRLSFEDTYASQTLP